MPAIILISFILTLKMPYLIVSDGNENVKLRFSLAVNKNFSLYYVHSVQKTPVWENYTLGPGESLLLFSTAYHSLGVGLPFQSGEGKLVNFHNRFILKDLNRSYREVNLRAMPIARQALIYRGKMVLFNDFFAPGALINIKVSHCSIVDIILWGGESHWLR